MRRGTRCPTTDGSFDVALLRRLFSALDATQRRARCLEEVCACSAAAAASSSIEHDARALAPSVGDVGCAPRRRATIPDEGYGQAGGASYAASRRGAAIAGVGSVVER